MSTEKNPLREVLQNLDRVGFPARVVSVEHLSEVQDDLEGHLSSGRLDLDLYKKYMSRFAFNLLQEHPTAKTLIIAAAPQPSLAVTFTHSGQNIEAIVPPTYAEHTDEKVREAIEAVLRPAGRKAARVRLPEKLLVARSGLGRYGKNNISYVDGLGSFHRPIALWTDAEYDRDDWQEPKMLDRCEHCIACIEKCPTGAIPPDRFLIRAQRCLTFHNESKEPFPSWIDPSWHTCLVGCMVCQEICPENRPFSRKHEKTVTFSEEETETILRHTSGQTLPAAIAAKLERFWPKYLQDVLPRNLGVLLNK